MRLKVTVSWITSLPVKRCGVITMKWSQNISPQSGHVNFPLRKNLKTQPSVCKAMSLGPERMVLLNFLERGQTINSDHYTMMLTKLNAQTSRIRPEKKITFLLQHDNTRPSASLKIVEYTASPGWTVLPHPLYSPDLVPRDFHLLRLMTKMDCMGNIFLAIISSQQL